jgi:hypothetical protein
MSIETRPSPASTLLAWIAERRELPWQRTTSTIGARGLRITQMNSVVEPPGGGSSGAIRLVRVRSRDGSLDTVRVSIRGAGEVGFHHLSMDTAQEQELALRVADDLEVGLVPTPDGIEPAMADDQAWRRGAEQLWASGGQDGLGV